MSLTSETYRVHVYLVGLDKDRASELRSILQIYNKSQGRVWFKDVLQRAYKGERVPIYHTNDDLDAKRFGMALLRAGGQVEIDGLVEEEDFLFEDEFEEEPTDEDE